MDVFAGRSAVVTGAASGLGRALALRAAAEGMRVLAADVDDRGLESLEPKLLAAGAPAARVRHSDVSKAAEVESLCAAAREWLGPVHLLFNNAGVLLGGCAWERSEADWHWVLDVNLWGVIHGVRCFVPHMLEQGEPARVVNTASLGGLLGGPYLSPYVVSKHAVVALSEALYYELADAGRDVGVSVLCPGAVATGIGESERIRPPERGRAAPLTGRPEQAFVGAIRRGIAAGSEPDEVARFTFDAVREGRFWILPDPSYRERLERRVASILSGGPPPALGSASGD